MNEILNNLDKSVLDEDTLKLLELDTDSIKQQDTVPGDNISQEDIILDDNEYVKSELGIDMNAIQKGLELRSKRETDGLDTYYEDVFTNIIKPNKNWRLKDVKKYFGLFDTNGKENIKNVLNLLYNELSK